jgi:hypothetical protein
MFEPTFTQLLLHQTISRTVRVEVAFVEQLFDSSEKRLVQHSSCWQVQGHCTDERGRLRKRVEGAHDAVGSALNSEAPRQGSHETDKTS